MKAIIGFFKHKSVIQLVGLIALCTIIWFIGPKLAYGQQAPLESEFNRLLAILVVVIVWAVYNLILQSRAGQKEDHLLVNMARQQADPAQADIDEKQSEEAAILERKFEEALQFLKKKHSKSIWDRKYIYKMPWYVIIGPPGVGKTTLLLNSGLRFPLLEHFGYKSVEGVGGTRNCDWLFADDAIFLDTAGRYATQDSNQPIDAAAWNRFLNLIKKNRLRRPINGVLVAISMSDILKPSAEDRVQHAKDIRQRIKELYEVLGLRFPIYMLFTKCDLVGGFTDFFAQLNHDELVQVWGETFRDEVQATTNENIAEFGSKFDVLVDRLKLRRFRRIQDERNIQTRSLILDFPQQMALLKSAIQDFLRNTFSTSSYDEFTPFLRGVYFTSATQVGIPTDRVMALLAATYGLDHQNMEEHRGHGKCFFITRLLKKVVLPEANLAGVDRKVERRRRMLQWAALACLLTLTTGIIAVWSVSYTHSKHEIRRIESQIEQYKKPALNTSGWDTNDVRSLLAHLNMMKKAIDDFGDRVWWRGLGLYQGDRLIDRIEQIYGRLLEKKLLPLVKTRLKQRLHARLNINSEAEMTSLYHLLKVYLMFEDPHIRMDRSLANRWINAGWKQDFFREPRLQEQMGYHSANLLKLELEAQKLNEPLKAEARRILNEQPLYAQIYADLETEPVLNSYRLQMQDILPPNSDRVFTTADGQPLATLSIPGMYTYKGYHNVFKKHGLSSVRQALRENWVLNNYAADQESDLSRLYDDLQMHYFSQYKKQWHALLDNLKIKTAADDSQAIDILDILSGAETPFWSLLETVEKNTILSSRPESDSTKSTQGQADVPNIDASGYIRELEQEFENLHYLLQNSGENPPPLDNVLVSLKNLRNVLIESGNSPTTSKEAWENAIKQVQRDFDRQPEPFKSMLLSLTSATSDIKLQEEKLKLNEIWKTDVRAAYVDSLEGRYPIFKNSPDDITIEDFSRFFRPNGTVDQFFQNSLKPFVDTTRAIWRPEKFENRTMDLSVGFLRQLQRADTIRKSFFADGGLDPSMHFQLKPIDLDDRAAVILINIEGQTAKFQHEPPKSQKFLWPGPQPNAGVRLIFQTFDDEDISLFKEGPWAWFRILDAVKIESTNLRDRFVVTFQADGYWAKYELRASSVYNPFKMRALHNFRCPESF